MGLEEIRRLKEDANKPKPPKQYSIPKKSEKRLAKEKKQREERGDDDTELQKWFRARIRQMTGRCAECGAKTETHVFKYATFSICHLLDKRDAVCPSVKTHPLNWIELCPDHHDLFDKSSWEEKEKWGCWQTIFERLIMVEPSVAEEEKRFLPDSVRKYVEDSKPF